jgi:hypothetical protein
MGAQKKKRGRPRKERPEEKQEYWKNVLHDHRLGPERAASKRLRWEWILGENAGPLLERPRSITQQETSTTLSEQLELAADETVVLSAPWLRFLEYMDVVAEALSPEDNGAGLKNSFLQDARSRHQEPPIHIPAEVGSPAELRALLIAGELKISVESDRRHKIIKIIRLATPSNEPEGGPKD